MPMDIKLARLLVPELRLREDEQEVFMGKLDQKVLTLRTDSDAISQAFDVARETFAGLELQIPEPESFILQGVDLDRLGDLCPSGDAMSLVLAPHGLGVAGWQHVVDRASGGAISLHVSSEIVSEFALLDRVQEPSLKPVKTGKIGWSLRWIPSALTPDVVGLNHASGQHPSVAEMLALQVSRVAAGAELLDKNTFTWIAGTISGGRLAARHVYDETQQKIVISSREVGNQGPHMGARPPRW